MRLSTRYTVAFVNPETHARRTYTVYAFNKLDADIAGVQKLTEQEGDGWRSTWWPVGAERAK